MELVPLTIKGTVAVIHTKCGVVGIVDAADWPFTLGYKWAPVPWKRNRGNYLRGWNGERAPTGILVHRLLLKPPDDKQVDHIDGNGLNNTRSNLRVCTASQNAQAARRPIGRNGYRGVINYYDGRFRSQIRVNGKMHYTPVRDSSVEAAKDYDEMARRLRGAFCQVNFR